MKKIFIIIMLFAAGIAGCDQINPPYTEDGTITVDTTKQKILLEDFTGFRCNNCPEAHDVAAELQKQYKGQLIIMDIHAGTLATPLGPNSIYKYNFIVKEGLDIDNQFGVTAIGTPYGLVNRTKVNNKLIQDPDSWESAIAVEAQKTSNFTISATPAFNADTKKIDLNLKINTNQDLDPLYSVAIYITEDSIINYQKDLREDPEDVPDYVHMHVLRGSMTGTWGEPISSATLVKNVPTELNYSYTIPSNKDWKPEHVHLVIVVFNTEDLDVKQVEEVKLTPETP